MKYYKEFKQYHPETIGETDKEFDRANYTEWLEKRYEALTPTAVSQRSELLAFIAEVSEWDELYSSTNIKLKAKLLL